MTAPLARRSQQVAIVISETDAARVDAARGEMTWSGWAVMAILRELQRIIVNPGAGITACAHPPQRVFRNRCYACGGMTPGG